MDEIKHFFRVYKSLEGKDTSIGVVKGKEDAIKIFGCLEFDMNKYEIKKNGEKRVPLSMEFAMIFIRFRIEFNSI